LYWEGFVTQDDVNSTTLQRLYHRHITKGGTKAISCISNTVPTVYWGHKQSHIFITYIYL